MALLTRFFEWYLGLPGSQAGQRTDWRFEFETVPYGWPTAVLVLLTAAAGVYLVAVYWRDAAGISPGRRTLLTGLRLTVVALAGLCLLQLTLSVGRIGLPVIAILIDNSASMGLDDRYPDEKTNELADQLIHDSGISAKSRLGLAQAVLTGDDGRFLRQLLKNHTLRLYRFADGAVRLGSRDFTGPVDLPEMTQKIRELKADGNQTRPGPAVRKVLEDFRGNPPAAIVVFSDGVSSTGDADRLSPAAEVAAANFVPLDTVGLGSEQPARDIQLYDVTAEDLAFVGDPYSVSGKIKADGFAGRSVPVRLMERDSGRVLAQTTVNLNAGSAPVAFELSYVPSVAGELDLSIEVPPLPEESNRENNRETRHLSVRKEKIRVLLADSSPRWEYRYLKTLLERDPTVSLKSVLQEADIEYASEDKTALTHFPLNRDELFGYDVLILGDLNPALLGTSTMELIRDFVRDSGGGVFLIAGTSFNPLAYRGTPLEALVPLDLSNVQSLPEQFVAEQGFRPELTIDGLRGTGIFRMADSESASLEVWSQLPEFHWLFGSAPAKPSARVFAVWRRGGGPSTAVPIVAMQSFGAGKVLFNATDEIWRWRYRAGDHYFGPFWSRAIRYLSRSRLLGRDRSAELTSDRVVYTQGESPTLRVRFFDERFVPAATERVVVTLERRNGERRSLSLTKSAGQATAFEGQAALLPLGTYHTWITDPSFREAPPATDFRIETGSEELVRRNLDRREMEQSASISRGVFCTLEDAADLPGRIPPGHPVALSSRERVPLWNRWEVLVLLAALLTAEWILRKRARLV
jgi:hypothetical protein